MKTPSRPLRPQNTPARPLAWIGSAAAAVALLAAGGVAGRALALPLAPSLVGLVLVALGLRVAVMVVSVFPPGEAPAGPRRPGRHDGALRAA